MECHIKKSRFSEKSRFNESKCSDGAHSLNLDFTVHIVIAGLFYGFRTGRIDDDIEYRTLDVEMSNPDVTISYLEDIPVIEQDEPTEFNLTVTANLDNGFFDTDDALLPHVLFFPDIDVCKELAKDKCSYEGSVDVATVFDNSQFVEDVFGVLTYDKVEGGCLAIVAKVESRPETEMDDNNSGSGGATQRDGDNNECIVIAHKVVEDEEESGSSSGKKCLIFAPGLSFIPSL